MEACPWFDASLGKQIVVSAAQFRRYDLASEWYLTEVNRRLVVKYPQHMPVQEGAAGVPRMEEFLQTLLHAVEKLSEGEKEKH
jgi:hypothetical protein